MLGVRGSNLGLVLIFFFAQKVLKTSSKRPQNFSAQNLFRFFSQTFSSISRHFDISVHMTKNNNNNKVTSKTAITCLAVKNQKKISWLDRDRDSNHGPPALLSETLLRSAQNLIKHLGTNGKNSQAASPGNKFLKLG